MVLCYGGIALETVIDLPYQPKPGIAHIICEEHSRLGGGSAHVAEWLSSWGIPTRLSGYVLGRDPAGDQIWHWLSRYRDLDLSRLQRAEAVQTLVSRTIPFPNGDKYLLCVGYAHVTVTPPTPDLLEDVDILEIAFYHRQERGNAAAAEMAHLAAARGVKIVAMDVISPDAFELPAVDVIINSAASIRDEFPAADIRAHSRALQARNGGIVIVTDGGHELLAIDQTGVEYTLLPPIVTPTDTTGAGDSFRAGMIYGVKQGWTLPESLRWAAAVGALQVQRSLSQDAPASHDTIAALANRIEVRSTPAR
ncbi:MAG: carbohydrate kinase family protein [Anaerolineales bacterium]|nr:carbohydrate kinase family protein [Anaerolineales bacterium]